MIVVAKLKAKKGEEAKMEAALRDMVAKVAQEQGTLTYTLHRAQKAFLGLKAWNCPP